MLECCERREKEEGKKKNQRKRGTSNGARMFVCLCVCVLPFCSSVFGWRSFFTMLAAVQALSFVLGLLSLILWSSCAVVPRDTF